MEKMESIKVFRGNYSFLSNFYKTPVEYDGLVFPSAEAAFQAAKCLNVVTRQLFQKLPPKDARKLGNQVHFRNDWDKVKVSVMNEILLNKFEPEELKMKLLNTGTATLIEENTWNDTYWGVCNGKGENMLGRTLMEVRTQLKKKKEKKKMKTPTPKVQAMPYLVNEGAVTEGMEQDERELICSLIRKQLLLENPILISNGTTISLDPMVLSVNEQRNRCEIKFTTKIEPLYKLTYGEFYKLTFNEKVELYRDFVQKTVKPYGWVYLVNWKHKRITELRDIPNDTKVGYCGTSWDGTPSVTVYPTVTDYLEHLKDDNDDARRIWVCKGLDTNGNERNLYLKDMHKYADTDPELLRKIAFLKPLIDMPDWIVPSELIDPDRTACNISDLYVHPYEKSNYAAPKSKDCMFIGNSGYEAEAQGPATYMTKMTRQSLHCHYGKYSEITEAEYQDIVAYVNAMYDYFMATANGEAGTSLNAFLNSSEEIITCPHCGALMKISEDATTHARYSRCPECGYDSETLLDEDNSRYFNEYLTGPEAGEYDPDFDDYEYKQDLYNPDDAPVEPDVEFADLTEEAE